MPILHKIRNDWDFDVTTEPAKVTNPVTGEDTRTGGYVNMRTDTGEIVGRYVSKRYAVANNREIVGRGLDALRGAGLNPDTAEFNAYGFNEGRSWRFEWAWKDQTIKVPQVGDELGLRLSVSNSFDRSKKIAWALGMLRLVCSNGMTALNNAFHLSNKHNGGLNLDRMSGALGEALDNFQPEKVGKDFQNLAEVEIDQQQGLHILQNFVEDVVGFSERSRSRVSEIWNAPTYEADSGRNMYNLYNATTQYLTHDLNENRREMAEDVSQGVLELLVSASRNETERNKLWTPREQIAVTEKQEEVIQVTE